MTDYRKLAEQYLILLEGGPPSNYSAWSPDVLGCAGVGDTVEECVASMRAGLALHLEGLEIEGYPIPEPSNGPGVYVEVAPAGAPLT